MPHATSGLPAERVWWAGRARKRLAPEARSAIAELGGSRDPEAEHAFDRRSRYKVAFLFLGFAVTYGAHAYFQPRVPLTLVAVALCGGFFVPYTRLFMHSQMHWGLGGGNVTRFLLNHLLSLLYSLPQTAYVVGHRLHHRFDNDYHPSGFPRDPQSTFMFSRDGKTTSIFLWVPYYAFIFQHVLPPWLVFRHGSRRERVGYVAEIVVIVAFHAALYQVSAPSYLSVYLPSLAVAWFGSAVVLYMMHAVDADVYEVHPTLTSLSRFFNWFGDNEGYHLEHSLYASVHPLYLPKVHAIVAPASAQVVRDHYFVAGVKYAFRSLFGRRAMRPARDVDPGSPCVSTPVGPSLGSPRRSESGEVPGVRRL